MKTLLVEKPFSFKGNIVEGGWTFDVPEILIDPGDEVLLRWARKFQAFGVPPGKSVEAAQAAASRIWEIKIMREARYSVQYYAKIYLKAFGDLEGFDATRIAKEYVPYNPHGKGRFGKVEMRNLLGEMRRGE